MNKKAILNYVAILSIFFFSGAGMYLTPAIVVFQNAFPSIAMSTIMMVITLPSLVSMPVMLLIGGVVGKKISYKMTCLLGTIFIIIGGVLPYFINSSWIFILVCRAILGVGAGFYGIRNALLIKSVSIEKQAASIGYGMVIATLGGAIIQPLAGALAISKIGWRAPFLINLIPVIIILLILFGLKEPEKDVIEENIKDGKAYDNAKLGWKIIFYTILQLLATVSLFPLLSGMAIFIEAYGLGSAATAGMVISAYTIGGAVSNMILAQILKIFKRFTISFTAVLVILGQAICLYIPSIATAFIGAIIAGFAFMIITGGLQVYNAQVAPPSKVALGSTMILAFLQLAVFLSSYYIDGCNAVFKMKGSYVDSAFFGCIIIYTIIFVFTLIVDVSPKQIKNSAKQLD